MKMYVCGYKLLSREQNWEDAQVKYSKDPKWPMTSVEAELLCQRLNALGVPVSVGPHRCQFSVEELPEGEFTIVCLSHPDSLSK